MKNYLKIGIILLCCSSCVHSIDSIKEEITIQVEDSCQKNIRYSDQVNSIINTNCAIPTCHVANGFKDFSSYSSIKFQLDSRGTELFISRILPGGGMPPSYTAGPKTLTDCDKTKLISWINSGYPNN